MDTVSGTGAVLERWAEKFNVKLNPNTNEEYIKEQEIAIHAEHKDREKEAPTISWARGAVRTQVFASKNPGDKNNIEVRPSSIR